VGFVKGAGEKNFEDFSTFYFIFFLKKINGKIKSYKNFLKDKKFIAKNYSLNF
jgi:hypothetical protein